MGTTRRTARVASSIAIVTATLGAMTLAQSDAIGPNPGHPIAHPLPQPTCHNTPTVRDAPNLPCMGINVSDGTTMFVTSVGLSVATLAMVTGDAGETMVKATISGDLAGWSFGPDANCTRADGSGTLVCDYAGVALAYNLGLTCTPPDDATHTMMLTVTGDETFSGSADTAMLAFSCTGSGSPPDPGRIAVTIDDPSQTLPVDQTGSATAIITATGSDHLVRAQLTGGADLSMFSIDDASCAPAGSSACTVTPPEALGSATLALQCDPTSSGVHSATLTVVGAGSGSDIATATITCTGSTGNTLPTIGVGSGPFVVTVPVGSAGSAAIAVADLAMSGSDLVFGAALTAPSTLFSVDTCAGSNSCSLGPGSATAVDVSYHPIHWGSDTTQVAIDSNDAATGPVTVTVTGIGLGGEVHVTPTTPLQLGPVPLGEVQTVALQLHDDGNLDLHTQVTGVTAPFSASATALTLGSAGSDVELDITCGSGTPTTGSAQDTITLVTPDAYLGASLPISVTCVVADTTIQVMPTAFDFGELRVGDPAPAAQTLTITNPTAAAVSIDSIALVRPADGLTLTAPKSATSLAAGASMTATLALSTAQETDLDTPREAIAIDLTQAGSASHLELVVTGEVGTAASTISPPSLDLGFGCVGQAVTGEVLLTNTGTGTLHVQAPAIGSAFTVTDTDPTSYPGGNAPLAAGSIARATVAPASTALGTYTGTLTWTDDVPEAYAIPVAVSYKATGTALSPLDLAFGTIPVGISSPVGTITLANCGDAPVTVDVGSTNAVEGTADAWQVEPRGKGQTIAAHGELLLGVTFAPLYPDPYNASLQLVVDGAPAAVRLYGQGAGSARERTFYGCGGCAGDGAPGRGGVLLAAGVLAFTWRRRRGSSSAR